MDRASLLNHLRATHFESGDRERALADARRIAAHLKDEGASRIIGIGSAFEATRPFTDRSDIDLVVGGIDPRRFFAVYAAAARLTDFTLDLTALETVTAAFLDSIDKYGVEL